VSTPSHDQPTRVLPATAARPAPTTDAPPPVHFWRQKVPAHIGRARTSTLVLGLLFVAFFGLYLVVRPPAVEYTTVETTSGQTVRVPVSELGPTPEPTEPEAPTSQVPETTAPEDPTSETTAPPTTAPRSSAPAEETGEEEETTAPARTTAPQTASSASPERQRVPATSEAPQETAEPETTSSPTG
jgi:outer membrane biosynthesis protein TonB